LNPRGLKARDFRGAWTPGLKARLYRVRVNVERRSWLKGHFLEPRGPKAPDLGGRGRWA